MGTTSTRDDLVRGTLRGRPFRVLRAVLLTLLGRLLGLRVEGAAHVPADGALIVVANHLHNADPVLLEIAFPRPLHFMAKKELFEIPGVNWIIRRVGAFPVDRGKPDRSAIRRAEAVLAAGLAFGMFPEGTRSPNAALGPALPGAAFLALRAGCPIVPVTIVGSERLPFNGSKAAHLPATPSSPPRRKGILIAIGAPFLLTEGNEDRRPSVDEASARLMQRLADALPAAYRGVYAAPPGQPRATAGAGDAADDDAS